MPSPPRSTPTPTRAPSASLGDDPPEPFAHRAGSVLGAGALASALAAVPAALRIAHDSGAVLGAWLAVVACVLVPAIALVALLRAARSGLHAFAGPDASLVAAVTVAWAVATFVALAAFGALLRATTHHHGLAGVTFALGGLALGVALAVVARRGLAIARAASPRARYAWGGVLVGGVGAALVMAGLRLAMSGAARPPLSASASAVLVDLLAFGIAVGFLSRRAFARASWLARMGMPLALGLFVLGGAVLVKSPWVRGLIQVRAPVLAPLVELVPHD